jgi:hypothetical protein
MSAGNTNGGTPLGGSFEPLLCSANRTEPGWATGGVARAAHHVVLALRLANRSPWNQRERVSMKQFVTTCILLSCFSFSFAQGIQGKAIIGGRVTIAVTGHFVMLTWSASQTATSYNVYRGTTHGGPYLKIASGIAVTSYADVQVTHNQTLYYVTTAVSGGSESGYSNETAAVIP